MYIVALTLILNIVLIVLYVNNIMYVDALTIILKIIFIVLIVVYVSHSISLSYRA